MDITRQQQTNSPAGSTPGFGPPNQFHHMRELPDVDFRAVVRPNFDTLYSSAWLDLTEGPVQIHIPDSRGRYYMMPMLDVWTDAFATPGKRTTGTEAQDYVVVGPSYRGQLPSGIPVIQAPTPIVWVIGRTQANGPDDYASVNEFQAGLQITELGDRSILARISLLGIVVGQDFDAKRFSAADLAEIDAARAADLLGDAWTLLVLREVFYGETKFDGFIASLGIARSTLTDRLASSSMPAFSNAVNTSSTPFDTSTY